MSRLLLVVVLVLALAGAIAWFTNVSTTERGSRPDEPGPSAQREQASTLESHLSPQAEAAALPAGEPAEPAHPPAAPPARREAATTKDAELARAQWIDGRVLFPPGTPEDEHVFVTAEGRDFSDDGDHRVEVGRDGSFRVAFSEKTRTGRFELEARYLYLDEIVRWKSKEAAGQVVLEPRLGARIAGHVRLPVGPGAERIGGSVELYAHSRSGPSFDDEQRGVHELSTGPDFTFDALVPGASPDLTYAVIYDGDVYLGQCGKLVPEAGRTLSVELELRPGIVVTGSVRGEDGKPIEGVMVEALVDSNSRAWSYSTYRDASSAADGSFLVGALAGGEIEIHVEHPGYEPLARAVGKHGEGETLRDLVLVLARGSSIGGTVRWPDGSPAEASLVLTPHLASLRWDSNRDGVSGKCDASGAFSISGLSEESYRVTASATKTDEVLEKSELTGKERPKMKRTQWSAEAEQVKVGTSALVLTLSTGLAVDGRVLDDLGAPLENFLVSADRVESGRRRFDPDGDLSRSFRDTDGSFRLDGFAPGEWDLRGRSRNHADSEPVRVTLPGGAPVVLVVPREAVVSGRVLDPSGAPHAAASVQAQEEHDRSRFSFRSDDREVADEDGTFEIDGLGPGKVVLQAHGSKFAPSVPQTVELRAGETLAGLVLRLRPGGTILGELVGSDGRPQSGQVWLDSDGFHAYPETDAEGRFQVNGVPPGEIRITAQTEEDIQIQQRVTLSEGETVRVRLAPLGKLVRLHGHVRAGGEPLAGAEVYASQAGEGDRSAGRASSSSKTDESGAYEIPLPGPGRYWLAIQGDDVAALSWRVTVEAPAVEAFQFDVAIPVGRISGRVTDAHGQTIADVLVESEPERHEGGAHGSARVLTDAEGRYELRVPAGQHAVSAGGPRSSWFLDQRSPYAEARVGNLSVSANGHLRGIDLVLAKGGILEGVARNADGSSASHVEVWSEESGKPGWSDENGRFELAGLAPGTHHIRARSQTGTTEEPVVVEITAGETRQVELQLVAATLVHLTVREEGALVGSDIRVLDERGRPQRVETRENGEAWLGPLIPGRYTVRAQRDGKEVERGFEVSAGKAELELELVFE